MSKQRIIDDGDLRKYRTEIPNMADDDLNLHQYRLYAHYKRVGTCWESVETTAKKCGMGKAKVIETRDWLADNGWIEVEHRDNTTCIIHILDKWGENLARYSKDASGSIQNHPGSIQNHPGSIQNSKKEPVKKEPVKNTSSPAAKETTELQRITNLLIWFCTGVNFEDENEDPGRKKLISYSRYVRDAKKIIDAGRTERDMRAWWSQVWSRDWRFKEKKQLPTTNQVLEGLAQVGTYAPDIKDEAVTVVI